MLWRRACASAFARNAAILASGTAVGHALTALAAPVLSRIYDPAQFGLLALFTAAVSILTDAASWRYGLAVVLPPGDEDAANLFALACWVVAGTALATLIAVSLGGRWVAGVLGSPALATYLWWVPAALLATGLAENFSYWATRTKEFPRISAAQVTRAGGTALVQVAAGLLRGGTGGLIGGRVAGEGVGLLTLAGQICKRDGARIRRALSRRRMRHLAREYADFPKFGLPQALVNAVSQSVPVFLLAYFFDATIVGLYAMAHRLLQLPARFIGQSVRQVFLQRASEAHAAGGDLSALAARTTAGLAAMGLVPALVIVFLGPQLFELFLGAEWTTTGVYARWMILWLFFAFINPPATVLTQVLRKQRFLLVFDIAQLIGRTALVVLAGLHSSALTAVALFSVAGALFNAFLVVTMLLYSRKAPPAARPA